MDKTENLIITLKSGKWEEGESLWLDLLEIGIKSVAPFQEAARELWRRGQQKMAMDLLNLTAVACSEMDNPKLWVDALRLVAEYKPRQKDLEQDYARAFTRLYSERAYIGHWVQKILQKKLPVPKLIKTLDKLVIFREGTLVKHRSGWGIGKVLSIHAEQMEMIVDLQQRPHHRIDVLAAADCLLTLDRENFEAMLVFDRGRLREEAEKWPLRLIHRVIAFIGEATNAREIKLQLCPQIVDQNQWSKWWTQTRKLMLNDPYIEASPGSHARYVLREKPVQWEDEINATFQDTKALERPALVLDYLKNSAEKKNLDYFAVELDKLSRHYLKRRQPWYALECYLVIQECLSKGAALEHSPVTPAEIFAGSAVEVYSKLRLSALASSTLDIFLQQQPRWLELLQEIFKKSSDLGRDTMFRYLTRQDLSNKVLPGICQTIIDNSLADPDALIWMGRQIFQERIGSEHGVPGMIDLLKLLLHTGSTLKSLRQLDALKKINRLFALGLIKKIAPLLDKTTAPEIYRMIRTANWLGDSFRQALQAEIQEKFPDIFQKVTPIYTTETGLAKYERELQEILNKKLPEISRAIGEALQHGDISENAELDAARELEAQTMRRIEEMQNNISRAEIVDSETIDSTRVGVGCKVTLADATGQEVAYTILGPWDVGSRQQNNFLYVSDCQKPA